MICSEWLQRAKKTILFQVCHGLNLVSEERESRGLPPGPISNPGLVALTAVAHPAQTDYFYFRLIDPQTGTHHFSKDFEEHIDVGNLYTKKVSSN